MRCGIYVRVSTDDQRDNGYSIDSQLRMIKEHCEKNEYDIVDVYNDAGHSGKDLMRPEMQRLLKDIKAHKIEMLVAIKVDRLTRNNYDGFWLLNYCEEHNVKIELILEPYDVSTANGEMFFGMNLVFGQRERKEIGARTKRAMEQMAIQKIHPGKAPYGYIRNKETGHLEIDPIEAQVVKEIFELCKKGKSIRAIAKIMKENKSYLNDGKWKSDRIYKILNNSVYIGIFAYGQYARKKEDILYVENYCEPIIDKKTWDETRKVLEKNKHPNYGKHIHLFAGLVKCPNCGNILSSTLSYKHSGTPQKIEYYFLTCKNPNCKSKGIHYNCDKIEQKLSRVLDELTRYIYKMDNEIMTCNSNNSREIKEIDKAIEKLKKKSKKLIDLYVDSDLDVETINKKNEVFKKEIEKLQRKKEKLSPNDDYKEYTVELLKRLDCTIENNIITFNNECGFGFVWDCLTKQAKKELINKLITSIEIKRIENYEIEITNVKFSEEFISKNPKEYFYYLNELLINPDMGIKYKGLITKKELDKIKDKYDVFSMKYDKEKLEGNFEKMLQFFQTSGLLHYLYFEDERIKDNLILVPKSA